jgi:VanZ family protein
MGRAGASDIQPAVNDKLLHFTAYFGLAAMAAAGLKSRSSALKAVIALILLGGVLEIVQGLVGRDMSVFDELTNAAGAVVGGFLARLVIEPLRRRFARD